MAHKSSSHGISRRDWLKLSSAGVIGWSMSGWLGQLAQAASTDPQRKRSCILLWMNGGPSQIDTFDPKPGHANGGEFRAISTSVPGIQISEHLPRLAASMQDLAIVRSMNTREADHGRATYLLRTGYLPGGPVNYPTLGSLVARENGQPGAQLPNFVSIAPFTFFSPAAYAPGFLGPRYGPLVLGTQTPAPPQQAQQGTEAERERESARRMAESLRVPDLDVPTGVSADRAAARIALLNDMEQDFHETRPDGPALSHRSASNRAVTLMRSSARQAFELDQEPSSLRDRYGRNLFGQGCLLARRLVERGVPFVEVTLGALDGLALGWDTHADNFPSIRRLSGILDAAWSTLMDDLRDRGLLESTLIVWMGEFGRTPRINNFGGGGGRDHWASAWSTVLAGGGIRGGQVYGRTSEDGTSIASERPISVPDFLATVTRALGIDYTQQLMSDVGRPIRIVDANARPIQEVLA